MTSHRSLIHPGGGEGCAPTLRESSVQKSKDGDASPPPPPQRITIITVVVLDMLIIPKNVHACLVEGGS